MLGEEVREVLRVGEARGGAGGGEVRGRQDLRHEVGGQVARARGAGREAEGGGVRLEGVAEGGGEVDGLGGGGGAGGEP